MLDIITKNAFRLIGTCANAKIKERLANVSKIKAYARVGKALSFSTDLSPILGEVDRSAETTENALSQLNLSKEFLKNALFWFYATTPTERQALAYLRVNDLKGARRYYKKGSEFTSLLSLATVHFLLEDDTKAIKILLEVIHNAELREKFCDSVQEWYGQPMVVEECELFKIVLEAFDRSYSADELMKAYKSLYRSTGDPLYETIMQMFLESEAEKVSESLVDLPKTIKNMSENEKDMLFYNLEDFIKDFSKKLKSITKIFDKKSREYASAADGLALFINDILVEKEDQTTTPTLELVSRMLDFYQKAYKIAVSGEHKNLIKGNISKTKCKLGMLRMQKGFSAIFK